MIALACGKKFFDCLVKVKKRFIQGKYNILLKLTSITVNSF